VKGVGKNAGHIVTERDRGGGFASISDVLTRVKIPKDSDGRLGVVPVNVIEALIEVGAFDAFGPRMGQSMVLRAARAVPDIRPVDAEWGILERSARQRARLGLTTGEHPLIALCDQVREFTHRGVSPSPVQAAQRAKHGARVTLLGVLSSWDERAYRRGRMVSLTLEGSRESVEGVMWDEERAHLDVTPEVGHVVAVTARVQVRLVSTERVGDDGETISESFERRDLTVEQVVTVPVDDPSTLVLPEVADFVAPETSELDLDGSASTEVSLQGDFQDPPDVDAPEGVAPVWVGEYPPVVEPPGDDEWADPDPGGELSSTVDATPVPCPVPAADADQVVIRLPVRSLGRTHPDLLNAVTTHGVPAGFYGPAGGVWSVPTTDGRTLLVIVGEHTVPGAAHMDQQTTGWLSLNVPQNAAA
jgi:DNA polymerase-3 subunit alpha